MVDTNTRALVWILCFEPVYHTATHLCRDSEVISVTLESPSTFKTWRAYKFQSPPKTCTPISQEQFKLNTPQSDCLFFSPNALLSLVLFGLV